MPPRPRHPPAEVLAQRARDWLDHRAGDPAGWQDVLEAVAVNLRLGFTGAVLAAAQRERAEVVATPEEWAHAGWRPAPGEEPSAWLITGRGTHELPAAVLGSSQVIPARDGQPPPVPGASFIGPGADIIPILASFARLHGMHLAGIPSGVPPGQQAAMLSRRMARLMLGDNSTSADQAVEAAVAADSFAWLVLRRLGASPASLIQFPPSCIWAANASQVIATGIRITQAAAQVTDHAEKLKAPLPPPPADTVVHAGVVGDPPAAAAASPPRPAGDSPAQPPARTIRPVTAELRSPPPDPDPDPDPTTEPGMDSGPPDPELVRANEVALEFFTRSLRGSWAEAYLDERRFGPEIRARWGLGYAPGGWASTLLNHFRRTKGLSEHLAVAAGLVTRTQYGSLIDMFRDRVTIPIRDKDGNLIAFAGRKNPRRPEDMPPDKYRDSPKYLNTGETSIYRNSDVLFGLGQSRTAIAAGAIPVLEEGYFDAIATTEAGDGEYAGLAACGTKLSAAQMKLLASVWDLDAVPLLVARDADGPGRKAAARDFTLIVPWCQKPIMPRLPAGADPADVFTRDGPPALKAALASTRPLADIAVDVAMDKWDRRLTWPDPATAHLVQQWDVHDRIEAVSEAWKVLAPASPSGPSPRHVAQIALRTGQRYGLVHWEIYRKLLPASLLQADPDWDQEMFSPHRWEPAGDRLRALAGYDGREQSRDPPATASAPVGAAFPRPVHARPPARDQQPAVSRRSGPAGGGPPQAAGRFP
jgi:DNA primase catalytic core